jgi:8-oxo-dGTP pyrophosphatase MutT (NUDIX family)
MKAKGAHVVFHRLIKTRPVSRGDTNMVDRIRAVLLCKRTADAPVHPGSWSFFGGVIEKGENPKDAALREIREELAGAPIKREALEHLTDVIVSRREGPCLVRYFECSLETEMYKLHLKMDEKHKKVEGEGLAWFTAEEVHHLPMRPEDRAAAATFFEKFGV